MLLFMDYAQAVQYIHSIPKFLKEPSLEKLGQFLKLLNSPQKAEKYIHITGTNGKGSVAFMTASVLKEAGFKVGLFTSPYIEDFCERIQINGNKIAEPDLVFYTKQLKALLDENRELKIKEFEFITALAFKYFKEQNCDIVVLEAGLGGRFDSTNIIENPLVSVITSISSDHTAVFGETIAEIAFEKGGIIKPGGRAITPLTQNKEALAVLMQIAAEQNTKLYLPGANSAKILSKSLAGTKVRYGDLEFTIPLLGLHQVENAVLVTEIISRLNDQGYHIPDDMLVQGIEKTRIMARFEMISEEPLIIIDGSHNEAGIFSLVKIIKDYGFNKKITTIFSAMKDKDFKDSIRELVKISDKILLTAPKTERAIPPEDLKRIFDAFTDKTQIFETGRAALRKAVKEFPANGMILICGSFYLAGELRPVLNKKT